MMLFALQLAAPAAAYTFRTTDDGAPIIRWRASVEMFVDPSWDDTDVGTAPFYRAIDRWNAGPHQFEFSTTTTPKSWWAGSDLQNGIDETWWAELDGDALAETWSVHYTDTGVIAESDIIFNLLHDFTASSYAVDQHAYGADQIYPLDAVAVHELGHTLGLDEEPWQSGTMGLGYYWLARFTDRAYPEIGPDAFAFAMWAFGSEPVTDVGVLHWRRTGEDRGYSTYGQTRVLGPTGSELHASWDDALGMWVYQVPSGRSLKYEFSFDDNSSICQESGVSWYQSTNTVLSSLDTLLLQDVVYTCPAGVSYLRATPLTVSGRGRAYVGPYLPADAWGSNNQAFLPVNLMANGDWALCTSQVPCLAGQGDCDGDGDCSSGLHCVNDQGASYGLASGIDVCM
jgi:hypothetical protein